MSTSGKAIFLSYASQDLEAAQRICDTLRAAGLEVWFDRTELRGGDAWHASIRQQIRDCTLFMPTGTPLTAFAEHVQRLLAGGAALPCAHVDEQPEDGVSGVESLRAVPLASTKLSD